MEYNVPPTIPTQRNYPAISRFSLYYENDQILMTRAVITLLFETPL